jgi:hypothetical protein
MHGARVVVLLLLLSLQIILLPMMALAWRG